MNIDEFLDKHANATLPTSGSAPQKETSSELNSVLTTPTAEVKDSFDHLAMSVDTSIASQDFKHAFDMFIRLQASLVEYEHKIRQTHATRKKKIDDLKLKLHSTINTTTMQMQKTASQVYALLGQAKDAADQQRLEHALAMYEQAKTLHETLPAGINEIKSRVQTDMLKIYVFIKSKQDQSAEKLIEVTQNRIKTLYSQALTALGTKQTQQAQKIYEEMSGLYMQLPEGYANKRAEIFDTVASVAYQLNLIQQSYEIASEIHTTPVSAILQNTPSVVREERTLISEPHISSAPKKEITQTLQPKPIEQPQREQSLKRLAQTIPTIKTIPKSIVPEITKKSTEPTKIASKSKVFIPTSDELTKAHIPVSHKVRHFESKRNSESVPSSNLDDSSLKKTPQDESAELLAKAEELSKKISQLRKVIAD